MNINQGKGYRIFSVFNILLMILICLMIIFPLYYMLIVSISDGAAIAREIAREHRGKLWAESSPERGNSFCFSLPRGKEIGYK